MGELPKAFWALSAMEDKKPETDMTAVAEREKKERKRAVYLGCDNVITMPADVISPLHKYKIITRPQTIIFLPDLPFFSESLWD
jgi:hypothetical protein